MNFASVRPAFHLVVGSTISHVRAVVEPISIYQQPVSHPPCHTVAILTLTPNIGLFDTRHPSNLLVMTNWILDSSSVAFLPSKQHHPDHPKGLHSSTLSQVSLFGSCDA
jgi:hypothetical protein